MNTNFERLGQALLAAFALAALTLGYWSLVRAPELAERLDNPRMVLAELRIQRGSILDRSGLALAETVGTSGNLERQYPLPAAAPVVGYYSLRYGTAGIEAAFDATLRGADVGFLTAWENDLLHRPPVGHSVKLTLNGALQTQIARALVGKHGAVAVLELQGDVLALVSSPTYDPNHLDENFETLSRDPASPLLDRAAQGLYQPGGILEPVVLSAALADHAGPPLDQSLPGASQPITIANASLGCALPEPQPDLTLAAAFAVSCPRPFFDLGGEIGGQSMVSAETRLGLRSSPSLPIPTAASDPPAPTDLPARRLEAAGQGQLLVSPLQMAVVAATIANHGLRPELRLVSAVQTESGWESRPAPNPQAEGLDPATASTLMNLMSATVEGATGHAAIALNGPEGRRLVWWIGTYTPQGAAPVAIAVLLEDTSDVNQAALVVQAVTRALP